LLELRLRARLIDEILQVDLVLAHALVVWIEEDLWDFETEVVEVILLEKVLKVEELLRGAEGLRVTQFLEAEAGVRRRLEQSLEFDDSTEVRVQFDVLRVLAAVNHLLDDGLSVEADAEFPSQVEEARIDQFIDYYSGRAELLIRQIIPNQEVNVLLALFRVQVVLRIVVALLVLAGKLAGVIDHAQVDLELLHLVGNYLVLIRAKYDLPLVGNGLRAVLLQDLIREGLEAHLNDWVDLLALIDVASVHFLWQYEALSFKDGDDHVALNCAQIVAGKCVLLLILQRCLPDLDFARNLVEQPLVIGFDLELPLVLCVLHLCGLLVAKLENVDAGRLDEPHLVQINSRVFLREDVDDPQLALAVYTSNILWHIVPAEHVAADKKPLATPLRRNWHRIGLPVRLLEGE
jgi:hypothetical protein